MIFASVIIVYGDQLGHARSSGAPLSVSGLRLKAAITVPLGLAFKDRDGWWAQI